MCMQYLICPILIPITTIFCCIHQILLHSTRLAFALPVRVISLSGHNASDFLQHFDMLHTSCERSIPKRLILFTMTVRSPIEIKQLSQHRGSKAQTMKHDVIENTQLISWFILVGVCQKFFAQLRKPHCFLRDMFMRTTAIIPAWFLDIHELCV